MRACRERKGWRCVMHVSGLGLSHSAIVCNGCSPCLGQLWFDIETGGQGSYTNNYNWLKAAVDQAVAKLGHARVGIYSSRYEWSSVMGGYSGFESFPLWWATYDGQPGFGGFSGFAGWTSPAIHQFAGSQDVCGASVDLNWSEHMHTLTTHRETERESRAHPAHWHTHSTQPPISPAPLLISWHSSLQVLNTPAVFLGTTAEGG